MKFVTIAELESDIVKNLSQIPSNIDLVIGIPRSGMLVASMIALHKNLPLADLDGFLDGRYYNVGTTKIKANTIKSQSEVKNVLVVEDSVCNGNSIIKAKQKIEASKLLQINFYYLAAYVTPVHKSIVDIYFQVVSFPRLFEWNYMHSKFVSGACFDIDGVLCDDPTKEQNDDGERYMDFILNAKCKYRPTFKIGYLVTSRLEKYRSVTETWLKNNGIEYGELIMSNHKTAEERRAANDYGRFKGSVYKSKKDAFWFVESESTQAVEIVNISNKPVFCIENLTYYDGGKINTTITDYKIRTKGKIKRITKKIIPRCIIKHAKYVFKK